jgi:fatty acid desaturase
MSRQRRQKAQRTGPVHVLILAVDFLLFVVWIAFGSQWVLGILLVALLLLSGVFLGLVPLPGDKRRHS